MNRRPSVLTFAALILTTSGIIAGGNGLAATEPDLRSASTDGSDIDKIYRLAQDEGTVVWYGTPPEPLAQTFMDAFEERYPGVDVEYLRLGSADVAQRFASEKSANAPTADLIVLPEPTFQETALAEGWVLALQDAQIPGFPADFPDDYLLPEIGSANIRLGVAGILYNTDLVPEAEAPETWEDLLDPRYDGQILAGDLRTSASITAVWSVLLAHLGDDFAAGFAAQDPRYVEGGTVAAAELLAAGEGAVLVPGYGAVMPDLLAAGAPIELVVPEFTSGTLLVPGLNATAVHPNAARLFLSFMLSEEGSEYLANREEFSVTAYNADEFGDVSSPPLEAFSPESRQHVFDLLEIEE